MGEIKINVLKGQHNLAQGNALGLRMGHKIVRAKALFRERYFFGRNRRAPFSEMLIMQFRPKKGFRLYDHFFADGSSSASFTQGVALG